MSNGVDPDPRILELARLMEEVVKLQKENDNLRKKAYLFVIVGLIISSIVVYSASYFTYQPKIQQYDASLKQAEATTSEILAIQINRRYRWSYGTGEWEREFEWNLSIPLSLYVYYWNTSKPTLWEEWVYLAKDSNDDVYIDNMIQKINEAAVENDFSEREKINFVISFVQNLQYTIDNVTSPWDEYPRYPIETLFDEGGDCEDTSILAAALLDRLGYETALIVLYNENHVGVGISMEAYGTYYTYDEKKYFYLETTGSGWEIGEMPSFTNTEAYIYPLHEGID